jgi:hypothetical protein
MKDKRLIS